MGYISSSPPFLCPDCLRVWILFCSNVNVMMSSAKKDTRSNLKLKNAELCFYTLSEAVSLFDLTLYNTFSGIEIFTKNKLGDGYRKGPTCGS